MPTAPRIAASHTSSHAPIPSYPHPPPAPPPLPLPLPPLYPLHADALNFMMADSGLPREQRLEVRKFFRRSRRLFKRRAYRELIDTCLSPALIREVRYLITERLFDQVWYLRECSRSFLEELTPHVERVAFGPKESIAAVDHLNVLTAGMATPLPPDPPIHPLPPAP